MFLEAEVKNPTCSRLNLHVECHIQNSSIQIALTKTFASLPSESNPILVTSSCVTNDEIYGKKTFASPSKNSNSKEKRKLKNRKASVKLFVLRANIISSLKNIQLLPKLLVIAQAVNYDMFLVCLKHHLVSFVLNGRRYWSVQSQSLRLPDKSNCAIFSIQYANCIII